jgi:hypothetical protein
MSTEEIINAYDAILTEEVDAIKKKESQIKVMAEEREKHIAKKERVEEIKNKIMEKRKLMKEKAEVDDKVKKTLKEGDDEKFEIEGEEVEPEVEEVPEEDGAEEVSDEDDAEEVSDDDDTEEVEPEDEEVQKESKQAILAKIAERKKADILKNIKERKEKAEATEKKLEENKEKVEEKKEEIKEKKEVRVGTLLEAVQGEKKRRFTVYKEEKTHFYLKELGTGKTFRIVKEKVELDK